MEKMEKTEKQVEEKKRRKPEEICGEMGAAWSILSSRQDGALPGMLQAQSQKSPCPLMDEKRSP